MATNAHSLSSSGSASSAASSSSAPPAAPGRLQRLIDAIAHAGLGFFDTLVTLLSEIPSLPGCLLTKITQCCKRSTEEPVTPEQAAINAALTSQPQNINDPFERNFRAANNINSFAADNNASRTLPN